MSDASRKDGEVVTTATEHRSPVRITKGHDVCAVCTFGPSREMPLLKLRAIHVERRTTQDYFAHKHCVGTLLVVQTREMFQVVLDNGEVR